MIAIDHVQVTASPGDEDALRRFYAGLLGLREIDKPAALRARGGLWFETANLPLHVGIDRPAATNRGSRRHVGFRVRDLPAVRAILERAGFPIERDEAPIPGVERFYTRDPAGNRVELLADSPAPPPAAQLGEAP